MCQREKFKICSTLTHFAAIKGKSREVPLLQLLGCCVISGWEAASNLFTLFAQKAMTPFSQFISFLFDSCYHRCLKLIQKVEYGWAAWGEWKQDCTRWDQTDDSSNSPTSLVRLNGIFLSLCSHHFVLCFDHFCNLFQLLWATHTMFTWHDFLRPCKLVWPH